MALVHFVLVSYDIADPRRLRRVAKLLEAVGERVQRSVFECGLTPDGLLALRVRLRAAIDPAEDSVLIQPLCNTCRGDLAWQGSHPEAGQSPFWII